MIYIIIYLVIGLIVSSTLWSLELIEEIEIDVETFFITIFLWPMLYIAGIIEYFDLKKHEKNNNKTSK